MTNQEPHSPELHDELTAYLDGELDSEAVRRVEDRLARDADYRRELQRMQRAWDLLDGLPRATVNESFTNSTLEMVAVAAAQDAQAVQARVPYRRRLRQGASVAAAAAAIAMGFVLGHWLWPSTNEQLLRDLPVLQHFELYYQADNIDFLHQLDREGLFAEGDATHGG